MRPAIQTTKNTFLQRWICDLISVGKLFCLMKREKKLWRVSLHLLNHIHSCPFSIDFKINNNIYVQSLRKKWLFKCSTNFTLTSIGTVCLATGTNSETNWSNVIGCKFRRRIDSLAASEMMLLRHPHSVRAACRRWCILSISPDDSSLWWRVDSICFWCCWFCCCWPSWGHGLFGVYFYVQHVH